MPFAPSTRRILGVALGTLCLATGERAWAQAPTNCVARPFRVMVADPADTDADSQVARQFRVNAADPDDAVADNQSARQFRVNAADPADADADSQVARQFRVNAADPADAVASNRTARAFSVQGGDSVLAENDVLWFASPSSVGCTGPGDELLSWPDFDFPLCGWSQVSLPDVGTIPGNNSSRYYRGYFHWNGSATVMLSLTSDNSARVFLNGSPYQEYPNGGCGVSTQCVNDPNCGAFSITVPPQVLNGPLLEVGLNVIAIAVNNTGSTSRFDATIAGTTAATTDEIDTCTVPDDPLVDRLMPAAMTAKFETQNRWVRVNGEGTFSVLSSGAAGATVKVFAPDDTLETQAASPAPAVANAGARSGFWRIEWSKTSGSPGALTLDTDLDDRVLYAAPPAMASDPLFGYSVAVEPVESQALCGGTVAYAVIVRNAGTATRAFDVSTPVQLSTTYGVTSAIAPNSLNVPAGASATALLTVTLPQGAVAAPIADRFAVPVASAGTTRLSGGRFFYDTALGQSNFAPADNAEVPSESVTAAWTTAVPARGAVHYRAVGAPAYTAVPESGAARKQHQVRLTGLVRGTSYQWYSTSTTPGGCIVAQSPVRTFTVGDGIAFSEPTGVYRFKLPRDYDQRVALRIANTDTVQRQFVATMANPYPEIAVNVVGYGANSENKLTLDPGQEGTITMAVHLQDATALSYPFSVVVQTDDALPATSDSCTVVVDVDYGAIAFDFHAVTPADSTTGQVELEIVNLGTSPLTDLTSLAEAAFADSVIFAPKIEHAYLPVGGTKRFVAVAQPQAIAAGSPAAGRIHARAGFVEKFVDVTFACPEGEDMRCVTLNDQVVRTRTDGWYCTNKPIINLTFDLPAGFDPLEDVSSAMLYATFTPRSGWVHRPHDAQILVNGTEVAFYENETPSGRRRIAIPPELLIVPPIGVAQNVVTLVSQHDGGHYVVATEFEVELCLDSFVYCDCGETDQDVLDAALLNPLLEPAPGSVSVALQSPVEGKTYGLGQDVPIVVTVDHPDAHPVATFDNGDAPVELLRNFNPAKGLHEYVGTWKPRNPGTLPDGAATITVVERTCEVEGSDSVGVLLTVPTPILVTEGVFVLADGEGVATENYEQGDTVQISPVATNPTGTRSYDVLVQAIVRDPEGNIVHQTEQQARTLAAAQTQTVPFDSDFAIPADAPAGIYRVTVNLTNADPDDECFDCRADFWQFQVVGPSLPVVAPTGTVQIDAGAPWTNSRNVELSVATDGGFEIRLKNDGDASFGEWQEIPGSGKIAWVLRDQDGSRSVCAQFRNVLGTPSAEDACDGIGLDRAAPNFSAFVLEDGAPYTPDASIVARLTYADPGASASGVAWARLRNAPGGPWGEWIPVAGTSADVPWTIAAGAGLKTVDAQVRDAAGNESTTRSDSILPTFDKVLIVAGDATANSIASQTRVVSNYVARAALLAGFPEADVRYLSALNTPGNNALVDDAATLASIDEGIVDWTSDAHRLTAFFVDHGSGGPAWAFSVRPGELLAATALRTWLDEAQAPGRPLQTVVASFDMCYSGGFVAACSGVPAGRRRVLLTSTTDTALASFAGDGNISYTYFAVSRALLGSHWKASHDSAAIAFLELGIPAGNGRRQVPWLDDNNDGRANAADGSFPNGPSRHEYFRSGTIVGPPIPAPPAFVDSELPASIPAAADVAISTTVDSVIATDQVTAFVYWMRNPEIDSGAPLGNYTRVGLERQGDTHEWSGTIPASAFANGEGTYAVVCTADALHPELGIELGVPAIPIEARIRVGNAVLSPDAYEPDNIGESAANELEPGEIETHTLHHGDDVDWFLVPEEPGTCLAIDDAVIPAGKVLRVRLFADGDSGDPGAEAFFIHPGEDSRRTICLGNGRYPWLVEIGLCDGEAGPCPATDLAEESGYKVFTEIRTSFSGWIVR